MKFENPKDFVDIEQAQSRIELLQDRLMECERQLDDMARCAEICMVTNQFHLLNSFVDSANTYLEDRIDLVELSERMQTFDQTKIKVIEDGLSAQSS